MAVAFYSSKLKLVLFMKIVFWSWSWRTYVISATILHGRSYREFEGIK
jgi:hypothetical protein